MRTIKCHAKFEFFIFSGKVNFQKIKAVPEGSKGIRILKNKYHADNEWWDIVIFDDGTKGFVASSSLKIR